MPLSGRPEAVECLGAPLPQFPGAQLSVFTSIAGCEPMWRAAVEHCACYAFQSFEWQSAFLATIGAAEAVSPVLAHLADREGKTLLLLPLGIYRQGMLRVLSFLGGLVIDYGAPVVAPDFAERVTAAEMERLLAAIVKQSPPVDLVWLHRMPETIEGVRNPLASLRRVQHAENAYALRLPDPPGELRTSANNRRKRRLLAKLGAVEFRSPPAGTPAADAIMPVLRAQKSRRWRETCCRDLFAEPAYVEFYRRLSCQGWRDGEVHLSALYVGDDIAAAHWGLVFRGRFYFLLIGRDSGALGRHSPGRLLIEDLVALCVGRGDVRIFDLTAGDEDYKREWSDHLLPLYEYLAPTSLKGAAFLARRKLHAWLKQNQLLRNWVRRRRGFPPV